MEKANLIIKVIEKVLLLPILIWIYTPIVAGFLVAMTYLLPLGFGSWWIFSIFERNWLLNLFIIHSEIVRIILLVVESILFATGLIIFLWGLLYLSKVKVKKQTLAIGGPYKYIRHPQHLGLILISLSTSLYLPWAIHDNIRVGSLISWSLFTLFLVVVSEFEEKKLLNEHCDSYLQYRLQTGMFFPKIYTATQKEKKLSEVKHWKRLLIFVGIFSLFVSVIRVLCIPELRLVGMWYDSLPGKYSYVNFIVLGLIILYFLVKEIRQKFFSNEKNIRRKETSD